MNQTRLIFSIGFVSEMDFLYNVSECKEAAHIAIQMDPRLKDLMLATQLGLSRDHPLAGWHVLTILYREGTGSNEPNTLDYLFQRYNEDYVDTAAGEGLITKAALKGVLEVLETQGGLIASAQRKVRLYTDSGKPLIRTTKIFRITARGSEMLRVMRQVIEAENTITANTNRIGEFVTLLASLTGDQLLATDTRLYNAFRNMLIAYGDVMRGMHKLDEDVDELANNLAFDHGSQAAKQLQEMLTKKAVPAYLTLLEQADPVRALAEDDEFAARVARSQQGEDDLDTDRAVNNQLKLTTRAINTQAYVKRELDAMEMSFFGSQQAVDRSLDSVFLLFQTINSAITLLSQEYEHAQQQTIDIKALNQDLDHLLAHVERVQLPSALPRHLPFDRDPESDPDDLLNATTMGPVISTASERRVKSVTEADNPKVSDELLPVSDQKAALAELQGLVMQDPTHGRVDHNLTLTTMIARDELVKLYAATGYRRFTNFSCFGRSVHAVQALPATGGLWLHCQGETLSAYLPSGFTFEFD